MERYQERLKEKREVRQRYREQAESLKRLGDELGLFLIEIATDDDMLTVLKTGLGMQQR